MEQRKIIFKAKRLDNGEWVKGYYFEVCGNTYIIEDRQEKSMLNRNHPYQVDPSTVCQFTGLKDKDGKEIWEHDIISIFSDREPCEVVFEKGCFIAINSKGVHTSLQKGIDYYDWDLQVIGNKFDGKEEK